MALLLRVAILVVVLGIGAIGFLLRTIREATATPADKAACQSVLTSVKSFGLAAQDLVPNLEKADNKGLREMAPKLVADVNARDETVLTADINKLIDRCRGISSSFRSGFDDFCDTNPTACTKK